MNPLDETKQSYDLKYDGQKNESTGDMKFDDMMRSIKKGTGTLVNTPSVKQKIKTSLRKINPFIKGDIESRAVDIRQVPLDKHSTFERLYRISQSKNAFKSESTMSLIEAISEGDTITSARLFDEALRVRIDEKVEAKKKEVAAKIDNSKTFESASKHKSHHIRMQVAKHPNTPHDILNQLVNDKDVRVAHAALANPKTGQVEVVEEKPEKSPVEKLINHIKKFKEE